MIRWVHVPTIDWQCLKIRRPISFAIVAASHATLPNRSLSRTNLLPQLMKRKKYEYKKIVTRIAIYKILTQNAIILENACDMHANFLYIQIHQQWFNVQKVLAITVCAGRLALHISYNTIEHGIKIAGTAGRNDQ